MSEINYSYNSNNSNNGNNNTGLGSTLRALRDQHNISQVDLCKGIMSTTKLSRIETGQNIPTELEISLLMTRLHEPRSLL